MTRLRSLALPLVLSASFVLTAPAHAVNKDMIQLQTQVQQLQDAIARLQQSNDERMGVLKDLVQQTADSVNKMSIVVNGLQLKMQNQQDAEAAKSDQISGQVQSLNDSVDELKARMARMEKALTVIQNQQQSEAAIISGLNSGAAGGGTATPPTTPGTSPGPGSSALPPDPGQPIPAVGAAPTQAAPAAPPASDLYQTAYRDYMAAKYTPATSEFQSLIQAYPDDNLSGNAYFYLGEIDLRTQKPTAAVKSYDHVLEHYPDNPKVPAAHLHKGNALFDMKQKDAGVRELRALIQRFPNSPEAAQAKSKLSSMGISTGAKASQE